MRLKFNSDGACFLFTLGRHSRAKHSAIENPVKCFPELRTDKTRKWRGGGGDHIPQCLVGAIGGYSLSKRLGHESSLFGCDWHPYAKFAEKRLQGRSVYYGCMYTCGTPTVRSWFGFFDNCGESEVAWLVMVDAASRENWQNHHKQARKQECGHSRESP
jgi:hypothetical protein